MGRRRLIDRWRQLLTCAAVLQNKVCFANCIEQLDDTSLSSSSEASKSKSALLSAQPQTIAPLHATKSGAQLHLGRLTLRQSSQRCYQPHTAVTSQTPMDDAATLSAALQRLILGDETRMITPVISLSERSRTATCKSVNEDWNRQRR